MALIPYGSKQSAKAVQRAAAKASLYFRAIGIGAAGVHQAVTGLELQLLSVLSAWLSGDAGDYAEDPPRRDFEVETRARRRKLALEIFGDSEIEQEARDFAVATLDGTANLRALVRALERLAGAEEAK